MRIKNQLEWRDHAMMQLRGLYFGPFNPDSKTLFENKKFIFDQVKEKKVPQTIITFLNGYDNALYDLFMQQRVVFLYEYEGQLYKANGKIDKEIDLPCFDILPVEIWKKLCDENMGGFYYRDSLKKYS